MRQTRFLLVLMAGLAAAPAFAADATQEPAMSATDDPYLWLEDVSGDKAMAWVKEQNAKSQPLIESDPGFKPLLANISDAIKAHYAKGVTPSASKA